MQKIFRLLGFGTNWERVNKQRLIDGMVQVGTVVFYITGMLWKYDYDMEKFFQKNDEGIKKEWAYKVIISFGPECPDKTEYNKFDQFVSTSHLLPSEKELRKNPELQRNWDIGYQWAIEYKRAKEGIIDATKTVKNQTIEFQIKEMERKIVSYEKKLAAIELEKEHSLLLKDTKISELEQLLAKKKWKFNKSQRKELYKVFKKQQKENPEVELSEFEK